MDISVVVPLFNEEESLPELAAWIEKVMNAHHFSYEVIFVDDGSKDKSWFTVQSLRKGNECFKGVRFRRNYGKSAALQKGFEAAQGDVVITMDAVLQDSPDGFGLEKETLRPAFQDFADQAVQLGGEEGLPYLSARFQLRFEGIPARGGQEHRSVRGNAPFHSGDSQMGRFRVDRGEGGAA